MYECFTKLCKTKRLLGNLKCPTLYINSIYEGKNVPWKGTICYSDNVPIGTFYIKTILKLENFSSKIQNR